MGTKLNALNPGEQWQGLATPGCPPFRMPDSRTTWYKTPPKGTERPRLTATDIPMNRLRPWSLFIYLYC